jgi:hypothetical protein
LLVGGNLISMYAAPARFRRLNNRMAPSTASQLESTDMLGLC